MQTSPRAVAPLLRLVLRSVSPLVLALPVIAGDERPAIFQDVEFDVAQEAARADGGIVILDAMTSWCGPCKQMDRTTWIDPRLVSWIETNAVAIQLDMDVEVELKQALEIKAFPTIVMFKGGVEFDRLVGLRGADEMLEWLGAGMGGKRAKDTVLERLADLRASEDAAATWGERTKLVDDLKWFGETTEATREHVWLWRNIPTSGAHVERCRRYRWTTQRYAMQEIASANPAAAAAFKVLRDELTIDVLSGAANGDALRDWIELNFVIGDEAATVRWANHTAQSAEGIAQLQTLESRLFGLLVDRGAWRTAGLTLGNPLERTRQQRQSLGAYDNAGEAKDDSGSTPMIPMGGGMQPARKTKAGTTTEASSPKPEHKQKAAPAIPLVSGAQKKAVMIPMIPMGGAKPAPADEDLAVTVRRLLTEEFRSDTARRYGALLAAHRDDEARGVAEILIAEVHDNRARGVLLAAAMRAGQMERDRETHLQWLDLLAQ